MATTPAVVKPARRRIVPMRVVSESTEADVQEAVAQAPITNLREQAQHGKEQLGLHRKIYVDLSGLDRDNPEVNWKQLIKARGVRRSQASGPEAMEPNQPPGVQADRPPGRSPGLLGRSRAGTNPLAKVMARLEAAYLMNQRSDEESDSEQRAEDASSSGSDDEEEEQGLQKEAAEGSREGGEGENKHGGQIKLRRNKRGGDDYDHMDEWIDDAEFIEMFEVADKRQTKETGYFVSRGEIERKDEMLPGFEGVKKGRRKKLDATFSEAGEGEPPAVKHRKDQGDVNEGGTKVAKRKAARVEDIGEDGEPTKKRRKNTATADTGHGVAAVAATDATPAPPKLSIAQLAAMQGQLATTGSTGGRMAASPHASPMLAATARPGALEPPAAGPVAAGGAATPQPKVKYQMPDDVRQGVAQIRALADAMPRPDAPAEGVRKTKKLPSVILGALKNFQPLFLREHGLHGALATRPIITDLMNSLGPFAQRQSIAQHLRGRTNADKEKDKERRDTEDSKPVRWAAAGTSVSLDELGALIAARVKPMPQTRPKAPAPGSDDDFEVPPPRADGTQQQQQTSQQTPQPAPGVPELSERWRLVPKDLWPRIYETVLTVIGQEGSLRSAGGKAALQEVYNLFPPDSIDLPGLERICKAQKKRKAHAEAAAASAEAAVIEGAKGLTAAATTNNAADAEAFAMLALQHATRVSPLQTAQAAQQAQQAQVQQQRQQTPSLVAAGASPGGATASPSAAPVSPRTAAPTPPAQGASAGAAGASPAPAAAAKAPAGQMPKYSDDELVEQAVAQGAHREAVEQLLAYSKHGRMYINALVRVLCVAGPSGLTIGEVLTRATEMGFGTFDPHGDPNKLKTLKNGMSKATHKNFVALLPAYRYALRVFPGVAERAIERGKPKSQAVGTSTQGAHSVQPTQTMQQPTQSHASGSTGMAASAMLTLQRAGQEQQLAVAAAAQAAAATAEREAVQKLGRDMAPASVDAGMRSLSGTGVAGVAAQEESESSDHSAERDVTPDTEEEQHSGADVVTESGD